MAEPLLERNFHPTVIVSGYYKALQTALETCNKICRTIDIQNDAELRSVVMSAIGTKFSGRWGDQMVDIAIKAVRQVVVKRQDYTEIDVKRYVRIEKIPDRLRRIMVDHDQTSHFTIAYEISALFTAEDLLSRREHDEMVAEEVIREVQSKNLGKQQVVELVRSKLHGPKSRTRPENKRVEVAGKPGLIKVFQARGQVDFSVKGLDEESLKVLVDGIEQLCKGQLPLNTP